MQDLEGIPWHGIKNASSFLQGWQFIYDGMSEHEQSSTHRLRGILWNKIKNEPLFQHSLWMYDMMDPQDARKTCKYLLDIISHIVDRRGREQVDKLRKWEVEQVKIAVAEGYNLDNFIGSDSYEAMKQMMMDADEDFDNLPRYNAMPAVARAAKPQIDDEKKGRTETQESEEKPGKERKKSIGEGGREGREGRGRACGESNAKGYHRHRLPKVPGQRPLRQRLPK